MNFTREPIIETIITPRDGCKLVVRSSKADGREEYSVDAVEVVSFGQSLFFRSLERPKSFLLPVGDFEVLETKETRVVLKNAAVDRSIKIGGGKEQKPVKEAPIKEDVEETSSEEEEVKLPQEAKAEKKRDRRRHRRRRSTDERLEMKEEGEAAAVPESIPLTDTKKPDGGETTPPVIPVFPRVLPPPTTLISETLSRYKEYTNFDVGSQGSKSKEDVSDDSFREESDEETLSDDTQENTIDSVIHTGDERPEEGAEPLNPTQEEHSSDEKKTEDEGSDESKDA